MTILKKHNNIMFIIYYIDKINNSKYKSNSLNYIMYIY